MGKIWRTVTIFGLPIRLSRHKLRILFERQGLQGWQVVDLFPLEECLVATIGCENRETYESFLNLATCVPFRNYPNLRIYNTPPTSLSCVQSDPNLPSIASLNIYCLRSIFELCSLKSQIALTKVCDYFCKAIVCIWQRRYANLHFSFQHFKCTYGLDDKELWDFCMLIGPYVHRMKFNTVIIAPVAQPCPVKRENLMRAIKRPINGALCRHLVHFAHLHDFEVQGKYLDEYTVRELARYCPQLRKLRLLDPGSRWLFGKNIHLLRNLVSLSVQNCDRFRRESMLYICRELQLKELNFVGCKKLQHAHTIQRMCLHLQSVQRLHLTAIADSVMLTTILTLPTLKRLKFYWLNDDIGFQRMLFKKLLELRRDTLCCLRFSNEPILLEYASQTNWLKERYASLREFVTVNALPWKWKECFAEWLQLLCGSTSLKAITCEYCRVFSSKQILQTPSFCKRLKVIRLIGCRELADERLLQSWSRKSRFGCQLLIEGDLPWTIVQRMRNEITLRHKKFEPQPITRCIECHFK
ncbi:uncharacterized protein LOC128864199 [Anastrepha ludens]|uniref:uncharacterized protein LOC128864199 n=1 Tax=Anastrepha ludens TaxID=28586 RepID=UPI0023AF7645|nr:uncharacterized protein LOC128864199 [Anastrepha ludens]